MRTSFDWTLLERPRWTSLSEFGAAAEEVPGKLYALAPCVYVMANARFGSKDDPGVGAVLWTASAGVALALNSQAKPPAEPGPEYTPPPGEIVGFETLTFAAALAYETATGEGPPQVSATYHFESGEFLTSEIRTHDREYFFESPNPGKEDVVLAIRFALPQG